MDTLNDTVNKILKTNFEKLRTSEAIFRKTFHPEAIHDMRVATRKLRAAIKSFKKLLPTNAIKTRRELQKLGRALGKKRDLDVFSGFLFSDAESRSLTLAKLTRHLIQSQQKILSLIKSKYYANLIESLKELKTLPTKQNILKVSRTRIRKALNSVIKIAPSIDSKACDATFHKLRISLKKLRYICEFFDPIFSKHIYPLGSFIEKTRCIQEILGEHQDAITGISLLLRYKNQFSSEKFLLFVNKYEFKKAKARKLFFKIWRDYLIATESLTPFLIEKN